MKTKTLSIDLLQIDAGTQNRIAISEEVVDDYAELISASNGNWPFPPLDVFSDGTDEFLSIADGFHRYLAAKRVKRGSVPCRTHEGTAKDARIFGMTANDQHGLRMTRADKRACVEWLLDNGGKMTQKEIAEKAGVSLRLVSITVADRKSPPAKHSVQTGQSSVQNAQFAHSEPKDGKAGKDKPPLPPLPPPAGKDEFEPGDDGVTLEDILAADAEFDTGGGTPLEEIETPESIIKAQALAIERWCRSLTDHLKSIPDNPWIDHNGRRGLIGQKVRGGCEVARTAKAVAVCPKCEGEGCKTCLDTGYVPRVILDQHK